MNFSQNEKYALRIHHITDNLRCTCNSIGLRILHILTFLELFEIFEDFFEFLVTFSRIGVVMALSLFSHV